MTPAFDLTRFVTAQDAGGAYAAALGELRAGHKQGHWMWFLFPQVAGLGHSANAQHYAVSGLEEARAYLAHPVLGPLAAVVGGVERGEQVGLALAQLHHGGAQPLDLDRQALDDVVDAVLVVAPAGDREGDGVASAGIGPHGQVDGRGGVRGHGR